MKFKFVFLASLGLTTLFVSCKKEETVVKAQVVKEITVSLAAANENPQPT